MGIFAKTLIFVAFGLSSLQFGCGEVLTQSFIVRMEELEQVIQDQKQVIEALRKDVAFTVTLGTDAAFPVNALMQLDLVTSNIGGGYVSDSADPNYGKFIAPVAGTYVFEAGSVKVSGSEVVMVSILVNGDWKCNPAPATDVGRGEYCSVVVKLDVGDEVWMSNIGSATAVYQWHHTRFTGYLLHVDV